MQEERIGVGDGGSRDGVHAWNEDVSALIDLQSQVYRAVLRIFRAVLAVLLAFFMLEMSCIVGLDELFRCKRVKNAVEVRCC